MKRHRQLRKRLRRITVAAAIVGGGLSMFAQTNQAQQGTFGARMAAQRIYYDAPNLDKVKLEVLGREATNVPEGVLIIEAKINSFAVTGGAPQLTAETPSCIFDLNTSQIHSTNVLQIRSGDGNLYVEGIGFLWQKTSPDLTLSNHVHTIIRQLVAPPVAANAKPSQTDVYSESATFDTKSGLIVYRDNIRVTDPQLNLTSAILTAQLSQGGTANRIDHIVAETNVVIDRVDENGRKTHATSDKAVYERITSPATNDLLTLSGHPRLETTNGWVTADSFVMDRTTGKIHGSGNCHFHSASAPQASNGIAANASARGTEIVADSFDYDTNSAVVVCHDHVRVDNPQIKLNCETLTAKLSQGGAAGELENAVAEKSVAIDYLDDRGEKTHATAEKAVYSATVNGGVTNKVLDLFGNPVLERTNGWIMADFISMNSVKGAIRAEGNHHTIFKKRLGGVSGTAPPAASDLEIFSDDFNYSTNTGIAVYRGNARVIDPQMRLQCRLITAKLPEGTGATNRTVRPEWIVAETNVIVDYLSEKGEKTHATGEKMVFTHRVTNGTTTNEVLELTGNPIIDMTNLKGETTHATGDKAVYTTEVSPGATNAFARLTGHPRVARPDATMTSDEVIIYNRITGQVRGVGPQNHISIILKPATGKTNGPAALSSAPIP